MRLTAVAVVAFLVGTFTAAPPVTAEAYCTTCDVDYVRELVTVGGLEPGTRVEAWWSVTRPGEAQPYYYASHNAVTVRPDGTARVAPDFAWVGEWEFYVVEEGKAREYAEDDVLAECSFVV